MKTLAEKIAVMQAAADGQPIEYTTDVTDKAAWQNADSPKNLMWDWDRFDYRIAKQKKTYWLYVSRFPAPVRWCSSLYETMPEGAVGDGMTKTVSGKWHKITIEE